MTKEAKGISANKEIIFIIMWCKRYEMYAKGITIILGKNSPRPPATKAENIANGTIGIIRMFAKNDTIDTCPI